MRTATPVLKLVLLTGLLVGLSGALSGCSQPLGEDQQEYVGVWKDTNMTLTIRADGQLVYESQAGGVEKSIAMPVRSISDSEIAAGSLFTEQTFSTEGPPSVRDGIVTLVVDGQSLRKMNPTGTGVVLAEVPPNDQIEAIVRGDLTSLKQAVEGDAYLEYWEGLSVIVQSQITPEGLEKNFKEATELNLDLNFWLSGAFIQRIPAQLTPEGTVHIQGALMQAGGQYLGVEGHYLLLDGTWRGLVPKLWIGGYEVRKPVAGGAAPNTGGDAAAEAN